MSTPLIETRGLIKYFATPKGALHAVDNVDLKIERGQVLGIVGESGCGKSTLGRTILRLTEPTGGDMLYDGESYLKYSDKQMNDMRKKMQIIFQDPYSSLNPRMTVGDIIAEPLKVCKSTASKKEIDEKVLDIMNVVGLARRTINSYPHELDGGRRQRVGIARALVLEPSFIVCDEPVSALDVSIQAQILNLMMDLQRDMGLTYMFITHDLSVVKHISTNIMVMYLGQCVESATPDELFKNPMHPYTMALLNAIPRPNLSHKNRERKIIKGEVSNPINPKPGCRFASRCPNASEKCLQQDPPLREIAPNHKVACTLFD